MKKYDLILDEFNNNHVAFDRERTVLDLFIGCVETCPDNTAIVYQDRRYTYTEVDEITTRLACHIAQQGGRKGMVASVLIPRCEYMPIVPLALLKAGMTYVPLDYTYPAERLEFIINDSGSHFIIATEAERSLVDSQCSTILLPDAKDCRRIAEWDDATAAALEKATPDSLLTILYTSGTTGKPKGALISQAAPVSLFSFMRRRFRLTEADVYGSYCSYGFDACNIDIFAPLMCGAALCIVPQDVKLNIDALHDYFDDNKVSIVNFPTAIGAQYIANHDSGTLRCIFMGGEKLLPWKKVYDDCEVYNCYGPTEAFVFCSCYQIKGSETEIPVGRPIDNMHFYILSESGDRVGIGEEGEICIAGPQVSRGYLNLPERTAQVFTPNPYDTGDYAVLYHTGDLGCYLDDGNIMVRGRRDTQVKIRGNRLELKEVEAAVRQYPGVDDATVDAKTLPGGRKVLVAYVVSRDTIPASALCRYVGEHKPSYMIPSAVVQLDALPLNQNGKVDRMMLPVPQLLSDREYVAPRNEAEEMLCEAYSQVLGVGMVGIDDDLTELGGDSLTVMSILELCHSIKGLTAGVLASLGTPRRIAEALDDDSLATPLDTTPRADYALDDAYTNIFDICTTVPGNTFLHEDLGLRISRDIDVERLQRAVIKGVDNHPGMKSRFRRNAEGKIRMVRMDADKVCVPVRHASERDIEDIKQGFIRFYDLREDPPYRIEIVRTEAYTYLLLDIHHLVADGVSADILLDDITDAYNGKPLVPEQWTAFDFAEYEHQLIGSPAYERGRVWHEETFASKDCGRLYPQPDIENAADSMEPEYHEQCLPVTMEELERHCARLGTTVNILVQCAFARTLGRYCGRDDALFVITADGRERMETRRTMGIFSRLEPAYCRWTDGMNLSDVLRDANRLRLMSLAHRAFPFSHLSISRNLMSGCIFTNQSGMGKHHSFCGFEASTFNFRNTGVFFAISTELWLKNDMKTPYFLITYKKSFYSPAFISRFANDLVKTLMDALER